MVLFSSSTPAFRSTSLLICTLLWICIVCRLSFTGMSHEFAIVHLEVCCILQIRFFSRLGGAAVGTMRAHALLGDSRAPPPVRAGANARVFVGGHYGKSQWG
jgi:hypothetical protein